VHPVGKILATPMCSAMLTFKRIHYNTHTLKKCFDFVDWQWRFRGRAKGQHPLQDELLGLPIQLRTSLPSISILAWIGILI